MAFNFDNIKSYDDILLPYLKAENILNYIKQNLNIDEDITEVISNQLYTLDNVCTYDTEENNLIIHKSSYTQQTLYTTNIDFYNKFIKIFSKLDDNYSNLTITFDQSLNVLSSFIDENQIIKSYETCDEDKNLYQVVTFNVNDIKKHLNLFKKFIYKNINIKFFTNIPDKSIYTYDTNSFYETYVTAYTYNSKRNYINCDRHYTLICDNDISEIIELIKKFVEIFPNEFVYNRFKKCIYETFKFMMTKKDTQIFYKKCISTIINFNDFYNVIINLNSVKKALKKDWNIFNDLKN